MNERQRVAELEQGLRDVRALVAGFHAVKMIRAWAAEENAETKKCALSQIDFLLGKDSTTA